jgi:hypothetical protein
MTQRDPRWASTLSHFKLRVRTPRPTIESLRGSPWMVTSLVASALALTVGVGFGGETMFSGSAELEDVVESVTTLVRLVG